MKSPHSPTPPDDGGGVFGGFDPRRRRWRFFFCLFLVLDRWASTKGSLQRCGAGMRSPCATKNGPQHPHDVLRRTAPATASFEQFSRATPTIWSTGERAGQRLALKVHEVRRDVHRAYTRCRPTSGPAQAHYGRHDLSSRGASSRENAVVSATPAPKLLRCATGVDCFENPCLGWKPRLNRCETAPTPGSVRSRVREARPSARLRRRWRRASTAPSGPRTTTRRGAARPSCPG